jgi:hypothetical protein
MSEPAQLVPRGTEEAAASLPPELVKKAIQKNLVNIAKKAADGKTLSARELRMLEELRDPNSKRIIVESLPAAATLANTSIDVVRCAKKMACPAFERGNRINVPVLIQWLRENADRLKVTGDQLSLKDQKLNEEVRRLRRNNDEEEGIRMLRADHEAEIRTMAEAVQGVLYSRIDNLSVETAGGTATQNHAKITAWVDEAVGKLSRAERR